MTKRSTNEMCEDCKGSGEVDNNVCSSCNGKGMI